jgi:xanthine dehydrogenase iron-sulfur cluster and FAD-binding subunit A
MRHVVQCGYLMSASALLNNNPQPSDADIDAAMSGNICRCGTYKTALTAQPAGACNGNRRVRHCAAPKVFNHLQRGRYETAPVHHSVCAGSLRGATDLTP